MGIFKPKSIERSADDAPEGSIFGCIAAVGSSAGSSRVPGSRENKSSLDTIMGVRTHIVTVGSPIEKNK